MKRLARLPLAALVFIAACGESTPTTPVTASPSALTPGKPSFDDIPNSLDLTVDAAAEVMPLVAGGATGTTQLRVVPVNGDGKNGCNLTGSTVLTVSVASSNPAVATVGPSSITFGACGDTPTLTVTPIGAGTATISLTQTANTTGATFDLAPATFTVNVAPATVATTLALATPSPASVVSGSAGPVALSATLTRSSGGGAVQGATIAFTVDGNAAGSAATDPGGVATVSYDPSSLAVGSHTVQATFAGATIGSTVYTSASSGPQALSVSDASGPVIVPTVTGTLGANGWYVSDVSVSWSVTDPESAVGSTTGCSVTTISTDINGQTVTCTATSSGGTSSESVTIKRDATVPTVTAARLPATANANGWNNTNVSVTFTGADATSGIASCTPPALFSADAANQSATGTCTDNAGNQSASASVTGINVDKTAPTIGGSRLPAANANGWNNTDVAVSFTCADALSGVDACGPNVTVSTEAANQSIVGSATDKAGNTATTTVSGISIDKTAPTAVGTRTPAANAAGWNNADVTVTFTMAPGDLSGLGSCTAATPVTAETAAQTVSGTCTDQAGNVSGTTSIVVKLDETLPTIVGAVSPTPNAAGWNNTNATVSFTCTDALSGVDTCTAPVSFTGEGNNFSATGNAVDNAGNTASATVSPVKIDKTAPVVSGVSFNDSDIQAFSGAAILSASIADALSGGKSASYTLNGATGGVMTMSADRTSASASITNLPAGLYNVCVQATDNADNVSSSTTVERCAYLAVYDPNGGFVTGGGWINSPENACRNWSSCTAQTVGKANFGFVSKYLPGRTTAPEGNTEFQFQAGNLRFKSTSYETLIVAGSRAQFWGTGTVNGAGSFAFRLTAVDGTPDQFRMEIWNGARDDNGAKIYDNQWGAAQDAALATAIGGGSIQIKR